MKSAAIQPAQADHLADPQVRRFILNEATARFLESTGESALVIVAKTSWPALPGGWAIYLKPVPMATAQAACSVLAGTHRAVRIKLAKPTSSAPSPAPALT